MKNKLHPGEAARFLRDRFGICASRGTLQRGRRLGGGPPFVKVGHGLYEYAEEDLRAWAFAKLAGRIVAPGGPVIDAVAIETSGCVAPSTAAA